MNLKNILMGAAKLFASALLITWLIKTDRFPVEQLQALKNPQLLFWGLLLMGGVLVVSSERWRFLARSQSIHMSFWSSFKLTLIGTFFSFFIPGGVGGDLVKSYYVAKQNSGKKTKAVSSIVFDRIIGLYSMLAMALLAIALGPSTLIAQPVVKSLGLLTLFLFLAFTFMFALLWSSAFAEIRRGLVQRLEPWPKFAKLFDKLFVFQLSKKQLTAAVLLSLISQLFGQALMMTCGAFVSPEVIPMQIAKK
jgi:glycosyltransferase 2 family protein